MGAMFFQWKLQRSDYRYHVRRWKRMPLSIQHNPLSYLGTAESGCAKEGIGLNMGREREKGCFYHPRAVLYHLGGV